MHHWVVQPLEDEKDEIYDSWVHSITWHARTVREMGGALEAQWEQSDETNDTEHRLTAMTGEGDGAALQRYREVKHALHRTRTDRAWKEVLCLGFATTGAARSFDSGHRTKPRFQGDRSVGWHASVVDIVSHEEELDGCQTSSLVKLSNVDGDTRYVRISTDEGAWLRMAGAEYRLYLVRNRTVSSCDLYLFRRLNGERKGNAHTAPSKS